MIEGLDNFSRSFAEVLFREFPEFETHAKSDEGVLEVEFTPGTPREASEFWLSSDCEEITVGLGAWHMHFDWPILRVGEEWSDPIWLIRELVSERQFVVVKHRAGKWDSSTTIRAGEAFGLAEGLSARVISWTGTHDSVVLAGGSTREC